MVVDVSADVKHAISKVAFGKFTNSGQVCIAPDYALVHEKHLKEFLEGVKDQLKVIFGEKPEGSSDMGKMINEFHTDRMEKLIKTAGGKLICGGKVNKSIKYVEPTVILEPDMKSELMTDEIFGPILPVFPYKDTGEALKFIKQYPKPLTVYYFGKADTETAYRLINETSSGHFVSNEFAV